MNIWLFQANPKWYKLVDEVPKHLLKLDDWTVKRNRDQLAVGDKVILWQSGEEAGIYAFGSLAGTPCEKRVGEWRVDIQYQPLLKQPFFKHDLKRHPLLRRLSILKMPNGKNPFPVTETEWNALRELISKDTVNIFTPYQHEENRFTNGLVALLELSSKCDGSLPTASFLRDLLPLDPRGEIGSFRVLRGFEGHADAELCGPGCCIRFETKIRSGALDYDQVERHLTWLQRSPQALKALVLLTPDDGRSGYITQFLSSKCIELFCSMNKDHKVMHVEWRRVHDHLKESASRSDATMFSRLVSQFLEQIHDRIFEQDFAGIIQKIAFGVESGVDPESYLDELKGWDRWNTPRKYEKLDGTGRKLLLYDSGRQGITVEVEIARVEETKREPDFPWTNSFVPNTLSVFPKPIPLSHVQTIPGFESFASGRAAAWNVTREQYKKLRSVGSVP